MKENPYQEDREQMQELLRQYENLKNGRKNSFIEEDAFEKIINYFEEKEDLSKALEAADIAIDTISLFSSTLLIRKADILLTVAGYREALEILRPGFSVRRQRYQSLYSKNGCITWHSISRKKQ